jgi:alanyl-tRNA synthetase
LFLPIINKIEELSGKKYGQDQNETRSMRIIADHLRAATFIMGDEKGIAPSNVEQGYVVRKLIRRSIRHGKLIGINNIFCFKISAIVIGLMRKIYPEINRNKKFILERMQREEEKFKKTIEKGNIELEKIFDEYLKSQGKSALVAQDYIRGRPEKGYKFNNPLITGREAFYLYSTKGLPVEIIKDFAKSKGFILNEEEFEEEMKKHQDLSRTASAGKFKGGLADNSEQTIKYHTTAHLLLEALRRVLGEHVIQKGSNITEERLRLDFSHSEKMTNEQKTEVEKIVNEQIEKKLPVKMKEMTLDEAKKQNAMGVFESKYGNKVKVYTIGEYADAYANDNASQKNIFSREICGGPHISSTSELGKFKIKKEESSSSGVRRIKAILI